jgi:hypothetical protein
MEGKYRANERGRVLHVDSEDAKRVAKGKTPFD